MMKLGIYANLEKSRVQEILHSFCQWVKSRNIDLLSCQSLHHFLKADSPAIQVVSKEEFVDQSDVVLVMGGDGTMLAAARLIGGAETPLLGVNLGGLGFLAELSADELYGRLDALIHGEYLIQKWMVLCADFRSSGKHHCIYALNDVVIHRGGTSRLVNIDVHVNGYYFNTYYADGLIVATPTGSTAYSLSAGGPILIPEMQGIILNPICPHMLTARPAVIPGDHIIRIRILPKDHPVSLTVDGQVNVTLDVQTEITLKRGDYFIHSVTFKDTSFFDVLRKKLQWGGVPGKLSS